MTKAIFCIAINGSLLRSSVSEFLTLLIQRFGWSIPQRRNFVARRQKKRDPCARLG